MQLSDHSRLAWVQFLNNRDNLGHAKRAISGADIDAHVQSCWRSAQATARYIKGDLPNQNPGRILEIGSSAGLNCFALQEAYPEAEVMGIEPEQQAVNAAMAMRKPDQSVQPHFSQGFGELLPLPDNSVDLIVCHTVIEHVNDVEAVVREIARVLSPLGVVHLDAPNYLFPYEPHLGIITIPKLGKGFVKFTALIQGQWRRRNFVNHLRFVTPGTLQCHFEKYGLQWHNRSVDKLRAAAKGSADIRKYRLFAKILGALHRFGIAQYAISTISNLGLYPSVLYTLRKRDNA